MNTLKEKLSMIGANLQGSEIRRLFAVSMRPNVISFAGGLPDPESFPAEEASRILSDLLKKEGSILMQYGSSRGSSEGIKAVLNRMNRHQISVNADEIIITSGAQQGINLLTTVFVDPGDVILTENPTFVGALGVFRNTRAHVMGVPMDENGLIVEKLEEIVQDLKSRKQKIKFLYIIPNFQNPSGLLTAVERRKQILQIATDNDFLILEDDPYGELVFDGDLSKVCPIKYDDKENRVIYCGSFSKMISPGIRMGWTVAAPELIERLDMARQMVDVCSNPLMQAMAWELCKSGFLDDHIKKLRQIYASRAAAMLDALQQHMPGGVSWTKPQGGFYIWLTLPPAFDAFKMLDKALAENVAYVFGNSFSPDGSAANNLRISFCHENEDDIHEGIRRLGVAVKGILKG
ncbi:PLP-dependent aminotransferase family protein [candidate division KSB1 bacterium]|nr:PLP-dependent aminotransferase family protein [candidate division KSB1 bacterium]